MLLLDSCRGVLPRGNIRSTWTSGAAAKHQPVRPCRQRDSLPPTRFPADLMPPTSICARYVIASGAKQSLLPCDPRLLRSARNDRARVFHAVAGRVQNAAIERPAKKDARISRSENKKMGNGSTRIGGRCSGQEDRSIRGGGGLFAHGAAHNLCKITGNGQFSAQKIASLTTKTRANH
jgi:hypothetical protein